VTLDGSGSYDEDGDILAYSWALTVLMEAAHRYLIQRQSTQPLLSILLELI
jgi:hypothetical protein